MAIQFFSKADGSGFIVARAIYKSHTELLIPKRAVLEHRATCLSAIFKILPGLIQFASLRHAGRILLKMLT